MDIPNIGDKSDFNDKIKINHVELENLNHTFAPSDNENPNIDSEPANIENNTKFDELQSGSSKTEISENVSQDLPQNVAAGGDILKFAQDYNKILVETVIPGLKSYDNERKFKYKLAVCGSIFFTVTGVLLLLFPGEGTAKLAGVSFWFAYLVWEAIKKKFERKLKRLVMPHLMQAFPGFYWQPSQTIDTHEINSIRIFAGTINAEKSFDDAFCGKFQDVDIDITECAFSTGGKNKVKIFSGAIIRLRMNKNFKGITIIRPKNSYMNFQDLKRLNLEEVKLEDVEFCKTYRVFSTDQIESRYLLTTSFIERFKNMGFAFSAITSYCVFCGKFVYIAPATDVDLFNLFTLTKKVTDRKQFDVMFNQIYSILKLVEHFKLNQRTGL